MSELPKSNKEILGFLESNFMDNLENLKEEHQVFDEDTVEVPMIITVPKTLETSDGRFVGIDRIKNDIRGVVDVTTVLSNDTERSGKYLIASILIKVNMRMNDERPNDYVKNTLVPEIEKLFGKEGGFRFENRPKILKVGYAEHPRKSPRFTPQTTTKRFKHTY